MTAKIFDPLSRISLTDSAQKYFSSKLATQPGKLIRLSTKENGCTGFSYVLDMVDNSIEGDIVLSFIDVTFSLDSSSFPFLKGTEIDLVYQGINEIVKFNNPNVVAECGCGESFSVS